jgi:hypothetical protein
MSSNQCGACGHELSIGDFPFCKGTGVHAKGANAVSGDECDVWVKHGICWPNGAPRHYNSKAEMVREAAKRGLVSHVEHICKPGTDKSPHTVRWI